MKIPNYQQLLNQPYTLEYPEGRVEVGTTALSYAVSKRLNNKIQWLLDQGAKVDLTAKAEFDPFIIAFKEGNFLIAKALFESIRKNNTQFEIAEWIKKNQLNQLTAPNGQTLLHLLAAEAEVEPIQLLIQAGFDVNQVDQAGDTPLHIAVKNEDEDIANILLEMGAKPDQPNQKKYSALDFAIAKKNFQMVERILQEYPSMGKDPKYYYLARGLAKKNPSTQHEHIYKDLFKKPFTESKNRLMQAEPLLQYDPKEGRSPAQLIAANIRYEQWTKADSISKKLFMKRLIEYTSFKHSPLLAPLMMVVALASLGKHDAGLAKGKNLKILINAEVDLGSIQFNHQDASGVAGTNTLFVSGSNDIKGMIRAISTMLHESSHFVANEVMKNAYEPYQPNDVKAMRDYQAIVQRIKDTRTSFTQDSIGAQFAQASFDNVFTSYKPEQFGVEIIVLIAQTVGYMGYNEGIEWLNHNVPDLMEFYQKYFLPKIYDYLREHQVEKYFDLEEDFKQALGLVSTPAPERSISRERPM